MDVLLCLMLFLAVHTASERATNGPLQYVIILCVEVVSGMYVVMTRELP